MTNPLDEASPKPRAAPARGFNYLALASAAILFGYLAALEIFTLFTSAQSGSSAGIQITWLPAVVYNAFNPVSLPVLIASIVLGHLALSKKRRALRGRAFAVLSLSVAYLLVLAAIALVVLVIYALMNLTFTF